MYYGERLNAWTHLIGTVLALAGTVWLLASSSGNVWKTTGCAIYGVTLVVLYSASTAYHSVRGVPKQFFGNSILSSSDRRQLYPR